MRGSGSRVIVAAVALAGILIGGAGPALPADAPTDKPLAAPPELARFNDLLADYQADTTLSSARLDRIEAWIGRITDRLTSRVDSLTDKQTTLQTNLPTYQAFQTDIDKFLSDIQAAGGGTSSGATSSLVSVANSSKLVAGSLSNDNVTSVTSGTSLSPTAVPEPATATLLLLAIGAACSLSARRTRR